MSEHENIESLARKSSLHGAAVSGDTGTVEVLLRYGVNPAARIVAGMTALHLSALQVQGPAVEKAVDMLIRTGANTNAWEDQNDTPLHIAVGKGKLEIIQRLLEAGADLNER